jgi:hypothetical protein
MVSAALRQIFRADDQRHAHLLLADVAARLRPVAPLVAGFLEEAEEELLAFTQFPREHWPKLRPTNPLERINREIARRSDVVRIHRNDASLIRLAGSLLLEQNDEMAGGPSLPLPGVIGQGVPEHQHRRGGRTADGGRRSEKGGGPDPLLRGGATIRNYTTRGDTILRLRGSWCADIV